MQAFRLKFFQITSHTALITTIILSLLSLANYVLAQQPVISARGDFQPGAVDMVHAGADSGAVVTGDQIPALVTFRKLLLPGGTWCGLDSAGTLSTVEDGKQAIGSASIALRGSQFSRLDLLTSGGHHIYRSAGSMGSVEDVDGYFHTMEALSAEQGWFAITHLLSLVDFQSKLWIDRGVVQINGRSYQKVTFYTAVHQMNTIQFLENAPYSTDFYFDPQTHLLIKTSDLYRFPESRQRSLRVILYEDYVSSDASDVFPHKLTFVLNGQRIWDIALNRITMTTCDSQSRKLDTTLFVPSK